MAKKVKRNRFGYVKPGSRKQTKKEMADDLLNDIEQMNRVRLKKQVDLAVANFYSDFCLALAWYLRNTHNYGAKRIERTIRGVFDIISDARMSEVGYMLFDMIEIRDQLLEEVGFNVEPIIISEVDKHIKRVTEYELKKNGEINE